MLVKAARRLQRTVNPTTLARGLTHGPLRRASWPAVSELSAEASLIAISAEEIVATLVPSPSLPWAEVETEFEALCVELERQEAGFKDRRYPETWAASRQACLATYALVRLTRPMTVCETGVADGRSTYFILKGLEKNGSGLLHSFDISGDVGGLVPRALTHRWQLEVLDPRNPKRSLRARLRRLGEIDIFIHDSDHSYGWQAFELEEAGALVRKEGWIVCDDANASYAFVDFCRLLDQPPGYLFDGNRFVGFARMAAAAAGVQGPSLKVRMSNAVQAVSAKPVIGPAMEHLAYSLARLFPRLRISEWLAFHVGEGLQALPPSSRERVTTLRSGERLSVNITDHSLRRLHFFGVYEPEVMAAVERILKPGDSFVDVGANLGIYSVRAARLVGASGHVYAFEPDPENRARLIRSLSLNDLPCAVQVMPHAVAEAAGAVELYFSDDPGKKGLSSLMRARGIDRTIEVSSVTLDSTFDSEEGPSIDVMKCDVEGAEIGVLRGATRTLENSPPRAIIVEGSSSGRASPPELVGFLRAYGYRWEFLGVPDGGTIIEDVSYCNILLTQGG